MTHHVPDSSLPSSPVPAAAGADAELVAWRAAWSRLGDEAPLEQALADRVRADARRLKRAAAIEVVAGSALGLFAAALLLRGGASQLGALLAIVLLVFDGVWLGRYFGVRAGLFGAAPAEPAGLDAHVDLTARRLRADVSWATFAFRATVVLAVLAAAWSVAMFVAHLESYLAEPWRAVVGFGGQVVILAFVLRGSRRARERAARALAALEAEVNAVRT